MSTAISGQITKLLAGVEVLADRRRPGVMSDKEKEVLFGKTQYAKR